jgi:pimeloyl-ACP methyl ester carboxylesterase
VSEPAGRVLPPLPELRFAEIPSMSRQRYEGDRLILGSAASPATIALVQQTLRATNPKGFMQAARSGLNGDIPPLGRGLTMPLLLLQGEEDRVTPAAVNAERRAAALPAARLVMLARCGHLPEAEMPERINALIADHLA